MAIVVDDIQLSINNGLSNGNGRLFLRHLLNNMVGHHIGAFRGAIAVHHLGLGVTVLQPGLQPA